MPQGEGALEGPPAWTTSQEARGPEGSFLQGTPREHRAARMSMDRRSTCAMDLVQGGPRCAKGYTLPLGGKRTLRPLPHRGPL